MPDLSRREFAALAAAVAAAPLAVNRASGGTAVTAQDLIDRIKKNIGVEWKAETLDAIKAGDPSTVVTGVVTTSMATLAVLQQAVKSGANLVITTHPTFYARTDATSPPAGRGAGPGPAGAGQNPVAQSAPQADPVFTAKNDFIARNKLVVFRLTDHWRLRQPDPRALGIATALGWTKGRTDSDPLRIEIPALTLDRLADHVRKGLNVRGGMRVIGDPKARVQRVGLLPGSTPIQAALQMLPTVDAIVAGEVREWESAEYVRDKVFAGDKKSLILLGRVVSEEPGMEICASWLKTFVPEVPIRHVAAGDPVLESSLMTAAEVVDRIKKNLGAPWRAATYRDTFKFGGPEVEVKGIATTVFCSFDLVERASAAGLNMIIPHEDTYWNDRDDVTIVGDDPLYKAKVDFMRKNNIVIFRIHDHMHSQRPDFTYVGLARELGLTKYETAPNSHRFVVPETTLEALAAAMKKQSGARALRVVGDPKARVSRIQLGVGYATPPLNNLEVDVVISGEQQEADGGFDSPEYALDAATLGLAKGWIMLGHAISEEPGMLEMAQWIKGFVPEVPVQLVRAGEPFWAPG